jgi:hypothetical protein
MRRCDTADIEPIIVTLRGLRVILARDLARVYGVEPRVLSQAVKRNPDRFPADFAFRLTREEVVALPHSRSQIVILKRGGNLKYAPLAFTEHGAIMAASVLNSPQAVQMGVFVVRAFVRLRKLVVNESTLMEKLADLERRVVGHDDELQCIVETIRQLLQPPPPSRRRIGFRAPP